MFQDPDKDSDSMSSSSNISMRSQPEDGAEDDNNIKVAMGPKLTTAMAEAKLSELAKMYNAEKE